MSCRFGSGFFAPFSHYGVRSHEERKKRSKFLRKHKFPSDGQKRIETTSDCEYDLWWFIRSIRQCFIVALAFSLFPFSSPLLFCRREQKTKTFASNANWQSQLSTYLFLLLLFHSSIYSFDTFPKRRQILKNLPKVKNKNQNSPICPQKILCGRKSVVKKLYLYKYALFGIYSLFPMYTVVYYLYTIPKFMLAPRHKFFFENDTIVVCWRE